MIDVRLDRPNDIRRALERQLQDLRYERDHGSETVSASPAAQGARAMGSAKKSALNTGARRKVGNVNFEEAATASEDSPATTKKTKKVNRAAPVIQHPQTMHRMQDWKAELDRRIREQKVSKFRFY